MRSFTACILSTAFLILFCLDGVRSAQGAKVPKEKPAEASQKDILDAEDDEEINIDQLVERAANIRDPFKQPIFKQKTEKVLSDLEKFQTTEFQMVGIVTGPKKLRAMVVAPNGKTYMVKESDRVGIDGGIVTNITAKKIVVREKRKNLLGKAEAVYTEIVLPSESQVRSAVKTSGPGGLRR